MSKTSLTEMQFTPKEIQSLNKDQPGISKTVFSHVSNLHGLLDDWTSMRDKGIRIFKAVSALKLHECNDDYYPSQMRPLMDNVLEILDSLKNIVEGISMINSQLQALSKLQPHDTPVISTWSVKQISENVTNIYSSIQKEYRLKQVVTAVSVSTLPYKKCDIWPVIYLLYERQVHLPRVLHRLTALPTKNINDQTVENVAHCRDEKLIEVYVSSWELEPYLNYESYAYLFAEVGLPGIV